MIMKIDIPDVVLKDIALFAENNSVDKVSSLVPVPEEPLPKGVMWILLFTAETLIHFTGALRITLIHFYLLTSSMLTKIFLMN